MMKYLSESEIFEKVNEVSDTSQSEIARQLDVSRSAVSQMMRGDSNMLSLAIRYLKEKGYEVEYSEGQPVRYFRVG